MFDFFNMQDNYEDRKVDNFLIEGVLCVDTCYVSDGDHPYETAISHKLYNDGHWVIVEAYDSRSNAQHGHDCWVETMTSEGLPDYLIDCGNSGMSQLCDEVLGESSMRFPRKDFAKGE